MRKLCSSLKKFNKEKEKYFYINQLMFILLIKKNNVYFDRTCYLINWFLLSKKNIINWFLLFFSQKLFYSFILFQFFGWMKLKFLRFFFLCSCYFSFWGLYLHFILWVCWILLPWVRVVGSKIVECCFN
jgi:hypothetical protein